MRTFLVVAIIAALMLSPLLQTANGQNNAAPAGRGNAATAGRGNAAPAVPAQPIPRWPDGKVYFGPVAGGKGLWTYPTSNRLEGGDVQPTNPSIPGEVLHRKDVDDIPYQPWARAMFELRVITRLEPYTRCKPSGGPRQITSAYGTQLLDFPELKRFYIFQTGGAHSFRTIFMDGRQHPQNLTSTPYGHSIGHWEGDTLVVDTVGFTERAWIASLGTPATDKLHTIEKFTRLSLEWTRYEITIDDPGAYTAPWTSGFYLKLDQNAESFEYVCQQNNASHVLTGAGSLLSYFDDPSSMFIP